MAEFGPTIADAYAFEGEWLDLGRGVHEGKVVEEAAVRLPLATSNRHGLIGGATGTGKTRTPSSSPSSSRRRAFPSWLRT